ncbi:MAG TPA: M23 family metallopeptidase, partial [Candidatus Saccharimonadales bacterium]|nr:M23 family metallopeptidase [Candidatus Saccharimonadales bacterium]
MYERLFILLHKFRFVIIVPLIVVADLFLMSLIPLAIGKDNANTVHAQDPNKPAVSADANAYAPTNIVTTSTAAIGANIKHTTFSVGLTVGHTSGAILHTTGSVIATSSVFVAKGTYNSVAFVVTGIGKSAAFMFRAPGNVLDYVSDKATASPITRPTEREKIPVINPSAAVVIAEHTHIPVLDQEKSALVQADPIWPIHGAVTTQFGVPHWPYQPTHTGIDISDGRPSGVTPIVPFRPGKVIEAVHSSVSLGNHVVVDHGDGITSVYGHMYSIKVQVGQEVGQA